MKCKFRNLVFEGGGVKGIAYLGALEALEERGVLSEVIRVGGTSAGAINAILVALNYSQAAMGEILWAMDFNDFKDRSFGLIQNTHRIFVKFGLYKGDFFHSWIKTLIADKTGDPEITFSEYQTLREANNFKQIYLIGSNVSTGLSEVFSYETTPEMKIAEAVRISMSIPFFFTAYKAQDSTSEEMHFYVDGGVLRNYPIRLFDHIRYIHKDFCQPYNPRFNQVPKSNTQYLHNRETLGFRLDSRAEIDLFWGKVRPNVKKITNLFNYTAALTSMLMNAQESNHLESDDWARTIYIDTLDVKTTDFNLSNHKKEALIDSGREGVKRYFEWYDATRSF